MDKVIKQKGFSLIEVVVAMGLMGAFVAGFMKLSDKIVQSESKMMDLMEVNDLAARVRYIMNDSLACNKTLMIDKQGEDYVLPSLIDKITDRRDNTVISVGTWHGRVFISGIRVSADEISPDHLVEAPVFVNLFLDLKGRSKLLNNKTIKVSMPVLIDKLSDNKLKILYCDSMAGGVAQEMTNAIMQRMCESFNVPYDEATGKCKFEQLNMNNPMMQGDMFKNIQKIIQQKLNEQQ